MLGNVGGFNRTEENHERIWKAFSNDPRLGNLRTEVTMRMVNGEYDDEYTGTRTIPLCNLTNWPGSLSNRLTTGAATATLPTCQQCQLAWAAR